MPMQKKNIEIQWIVYVLQSGLGAPVLFLNKYMKYTKKREYQGDTMSLWCKATETFEIKTLRAASVSHLQLWVCRSSLTCAVSELGRGLFSRRLFAVRAQI